MKNLDELGVGLIYFQGFEDFLALHSSLIDVVEIEPQTYWYDKDDECNAFKYNPEVTDFCGRTIALSCFTGWATLLAAQ